MGCLPSLSGVNQSTHSSTLSVFLPRDGRELATVRLAPPALIEDHIQLPGRLLLSSSSRLLSKRQRDGLSVRQIARQLGVSHSAVLEAIGRLGITGSGGGHVFQGQVPFGWDLRNGRLERNGVRQQAIRLIRQLQANGQSLNGTARERAGARCPTRTAGSGKPPRKPRSWTGSLR